MNASLGVDFLEGAVAILFYSWQSDLPNNVNRGLIRDSIDDAIREINKTLDLSADEAVRVDYDTQGVPGSPDIVETILRKIASCDVFVPDVSIVTSTEPRPSPNPNVMIEYGFARCALGEAKILPVVNTHFGSIESLPFNMRQRRCIAYTLAPGSDVGVRPSARKELSAKLRQGIEHALLNGRSATREPEQTFARTPSFDGGATFEEVNRDIPMWVESDGDTRRRFPEGPKMFLRLIPRGKVPTLRAAEALDAVVHSDLYPLAFEKYDAFGTAKSRFGVSYIARHPRDAIFIGAISQLLYNREIWGVETYYLSHAASRQRVDTDFPLIPSGAIRQFFSTALDRYLRFAQQRLGLLPPFDCVAGLVNVSGHRIVLSQHEFSTQIFDDNIVTEFAIENPQERIAVLLRPFFEAFFDSVSVRLPQEWQ